MQKRTKASKQPNIKRGKQKTNEQIETNLRQQEQKDLSGWVALPLRLARLLAGNAEVVVDVREVHAQMTVEGWLVDGVLQPVREDYLWAKVWRRKEINKL